MLRGNWRFVAALAGIAALLCAASFGAYWGSLYAPDRKQYETVSDQHRRTGTYEGVTDSLPNLAGIPEPVERAIANPSPKSGQDHEKRDLAAQEAMSVWAFWMAIAAIGTLIVTFFGTALIWRQVKLTREAVEETVKATRAMDTGNEIARNVGNAQSRGYLDINITGWIGQFNDPEKPLVVWITMKNWGQTPCRYVKLRRGITILPYPLQDNPIGFNTDTFNQTSTVWPGQETFGLGVQADRRFTDREIELAISRDASTRIYLICLAEYLDFEGNERRTEIVTWMDPTTIVVKDGEVQTWKWLEYPRYNAIT